MLVQWNGLQVPYHQESNYKPILPLKRSALYNPINTYTLKCNHYF
jgi:hypothetical protein